MSCCCKQGQSVLPHYLPRPCNHSNCQDQHHKFPQQPTLQCQMHCCLGNKVSLQGEAAMSHSLTHGSATLSSFRVSYVHIMSLLHIGDFRYKLSSLSTARSWISSASISDELDPSNGSVRPPDSSRPVKDRQHRVQNAVQKPIHPCPTLFLGTVQSTACTGSPEIMVPSFDTQEMCNTSSTCSRVILFRDISLIYCLFYLVVGTLRVQVHGPGEVHQSKMSVAKLLVNLESWEGR